MERHEVLAMMTALKLAGMRAAADDILATWTPRGGGAQASSSGAADHRYAAAGRDRRQDGALDQVPDGVRRLDGSHQIADIIQGVKFKDGEKLTERAA